MVVAEGVETATQLGDLRRLACDYAQGYLFAKPLTAEAFGELLAAAPARPAPPRDRHPRSRGVAATPGRVPTLAGVRLTPAVALAVGAGLTATGCASRRVAAFEVTAAVTKVVVDVDSGDVEVKASDTGKVSVRRTVGQRRGGPRLNRTLADGVLTVTARCPSGFLVSCRVDHRLTVPPHTALVVRAGSGDVDVERVQDSVDVVAGSGDVTLVRPGGPTSVRTGSGDVDVEAASDDLSVRTTSGDLSGDKLVAPTVTARSGAGDIDLGFDAAPDSLDLRTTSGDVRAKVPKGAYRVDTSTSSGDVSVKGLEREGASRRITATTSSGDIHVEGD